MDSGSRRVSGELVRTYPRSDDNDELIAASEVSRVVLARLAQLARSSEPVLICGETGTGKTMLAHWLHTRSPEPRVFRVANCAALSDGLLVDLLREQTPTTLFLDEVGELSPWGQAVLLHRLQQEHGAMRFVAATHRDLSQKVEHGGFSGELLGQLSGARVLVSPLRARREDIVPLALHFLRAGLWNAKQQFVSVAPELFERVERYDWPGNVRELRNAMLNALAVSESGDLALADLPDAVRAPLAIAKSYSR